MAEQKKSPGGLAARLITAVVALPFLLWLILWGPTLGWVALLTVAGAIGLYEYYAMTLKDDSLAVLGLGVGLGCLVIPLMYGAFNELFVLCGFFAIVVAFLLGTLFTYRDTERAATVFGQGLAGVFYVAFLIGFLALLRAHPGEDGRYWILMAIAIAWGGDTGAYFVGRFLGSRPLAPRTSPKKTWEGAIGGLATSFGAAYLVLHVTPLASHIPSFMVHPTLGVFPYIALLALPAGILGQLGDLAESLIKRSCGVKDSGKIIYGHGGILDRIDALLLIGPYVYFFYRFTSDLDLARALSQSLQG